jgi:hypothetical protein
MRTNHWSLIIDALTFTENCCWKKTKNSWQKAAEAIDKTLLFQLQVLRIQQLLMQNIIDRQKVNVMQL